MNKSTKLANNNMLYKPFITQLLIVKLQPVFINLNNCLRNVL